MLRFAFNLYVLGGPLPAPLKRASRLPRAVQPQPPHSQRHHRCQRRRRAANASDLGFCVSKLRQCGLGVAIDTVRGRGGVGE